MGTLRYILLWAQHFLHTLGLRALSFLCRACWAKSQFKARREGHARFTGRAPWLCASPCPPARVPSAHERSGHPWRGCFRHICGAYQVRLLSIALQLTAVSDPEHILQQSVYALGMRRMTMNALRACQA